MVHFEDLSLNIQEKVSRELVKLGTTLSITKTTPRTKIYSSDTNCIDIAEELYLNVIDICYIEGLNIIYE
ncbi:MAG: hypothetical protein KAS32_09675 [Candidatus Peribacteraceae bacterium]|nr:hypothetical protein [Candidatus Peribacteraceae bacterium]